VFWPLQLHFEFLGIPEDSQVQFSGGEWWPNTSLKVGLRQRIYYYYFLKKMSMDGLEPWTELWRVEIGDVTSEATTL
jgi:hypothetical protein